MGGGRERSVARAATRTVVRGTSISAAPLRTGMIAGIIGRVAALNILSMIEEGKAIHHERMTEMFAACVASMGGSLWDSEAATIIIYPVVPDYQRYPNAEGRDMFVTHMELGTGGAWMKRPGLMQSRPIWPSPPAPLPRWERGVRSRTPSVPTLPLWERGLGGEG